MNKDEEAWGEPVTPKKRASNTETGDTDDSPTKKAKSKKAATSTPGKVTPYQYAQTKYGFC
jgi:hypothetical protein